MSSINLPVRNSSTKPLATLIGEGKTDSGNNFNADIAVQINRATKRTANGRMRSICEAGFPVTILKTLKRLF